MNVNQEVCYGSATTLNLSDAVLPAQKCIECYLQPLVQETMIKEVALATVIMTYENGSRHVAKCVPVSLPMFQCMI